MKILTAVDQSRRDAVSLPYAVHMATALNASIAVVQAVRHTRALVPGVMRQAEAYVAAIEEGMREQGLDAQAIVQRGDPAGVIVDQAHGLHADLIILTTRGRTGLGKFVLGSVANAVLAGSPTPVLVLSEVGAALPNDDETRRQSAYLATVVWNKRWKGIYSDEEATNEIARLGAQGLDRNVLIETYKAHEARGEPVGWLDFEFQLETLRKFLPQDARDVEGDLPADSSLRAA